MKKIIALITLSLGLSLPASALSILPREEMVSNGDSGFILIDGERVQAHTRTSVDNIGDLKIQITVGAEYHHRPVRPPMTLRKKVGTLNFERIRHLVHQLSDTPTETKVRGVVCKILPPFGSHLGLELSVRTGLSPEVSYSGKEMREVLSPAGCWVPAVTRPKTRMWSSRKLFARFCALSATKRSKTCDKRLTHLKKTKKKPVPRKGAGFFACFEFY